MVLASKEFVRKYRQFLLRLREIDRKRNEGGHHDFWHDMRVARICLLIAPDGEDAAAEYAAIAAMLHSLDRFCSNVEQEAEELLIEHTKLSAEERRDVIQAVLTHSEKDVGNEKATVRILRDADRVEATAGPLHMLRCAQYLNVLPLIHPDEPLAMRGTYKDPKTVAEDVQRALEHGRVEGVKIQLPKAVELAREGLVFIEAAMGWIMRYLESIELNPLPDELREFI